MGEKAHLPHENAVPQQNGNHSDQEMPSDNGELNDMSPEEFQMLDSQLDALNSALDHIEQKNDNIHAQLLQLLQSNRDIRREMREEGNNAEHPNEEQCNKQ